MPQDAHAHADEIGSPDDGRGQGKPPVQLNTYAVTREPMYVQTFNRPAPLIDATLPEVEP